MPEIEEGDAHNVPFFLLQYNLVGTLGSQPGVSSVSRQSYNKGSNWLTYPSLGCEVRL